jgi:hypothetical protein
MKRLSMSLLLGGASSACGFAALGVALYADSPALSEVAGLFAGIGFVAGLACGGLHARLGSPQAPEPAALPPEALAHMVRATLASASAERQPRSGSAADRRPTPAELASSTLAEAAAKPAPQAEPQVAAPVARQLADSSFGA